MPLTTFLVSRTDLAHVRWTQVPLPEPDAGDVLVAVDRFALTTNNITYAALGDTFRYWEFFPAPDGFGVVPVWGSGRVVASRTPDLREGERIYGYMPMASHLRMTPGAVRGKAFVDASLHRAALPATYNEYVRLDHDPDDDDAQADVHLVLRPLFSLAFFLTAFLREAAFFGASTVVVSSASSKASIAIGCLLRDVPVTVVGLTSDRNRAFVESTAMFDTVVDYDRVETLARTPAVYVDVSGAADVLRAVHTHFGDALRYSSRAGFTHAAEPPPDGLPGPAPEMIFTPTHILALREAWGRETLRARLLDAQKTVFRDVGGLLRMRTTSERATVERAYHDVLAGQVPPQDAWILTIPPD